jgi:muramidase (phage lysozyme)
MFTRIRVLSALSFVPSAFALVGCSGQGPGGDVAVSSDEALSAPTCNPSLATGAVPAFHKDLLNLIATTEGTRGHGEDGYNVTFAYHYFSSCTQHPDLDICSGGYCSTAAGRYQFLYSTWQGLGYPNFHPDNQDRGAMKLVAQRGASIPTNRALTATEFVNVMDRISWEWASLPPGRYGQPTYRMSAARSTYCQFAGCGGSGGGGPAPDACSQGDGFCTETLQCDNGHWIIRQDDPNACTTVQNVQEPCNQGNGYCTATLQCDNGHWVPRTSDPNACTSGPG